MTNDPAAPADDILWRPSAERIRTAQVTAYRNWLGETRGLAFDDYEALWQWSVDSLEDFWQSIWDYFGFRSPTPYAQVLERRVMPGAKWFDGATLNYTAEVLRQRRDGPAIVFRNEAGDRPDLSWAELEQRVASLAATLSGAGIEPATASWPTCRTCRKPSSPSSRSRASARCGPSARPTWGRSACFDRFPPDRAEGADRLRPLSLQRQDPRPRRHRRRTAGPVADGDDADRRAGDRGVEPAGGGVCRTRGSGRRNAASTGATRSATARRASTAGWCRSSNRCGSSTRAARRARRRPSSTATAAPRSSASRRPGCSSTSRRATASTGCRRAAGSCGTRRSARCLAGATVCVFDGNAAYPDWNTEWRYVAERGIEFFGAGAAFYASCLKADIEPGRDFDLSALRSLGSTGSPLSQDAYRWIYGHVKSDLWLAPIAGGTDLAAAFICGSPILPVRQGEMQCRALGAAVAAFDDAGRPLLGEVGELVCTAPIPSMPLYFWNDPGNARLIESYHDMYPGVWRHGDWIRLVPHDTGRSEAEDGRGTVGAVIYGRSDATINRHGIRMGTAELYRAVEALPEVLDSLVVDLEYLGRESWMALFVVLRDGHVLDEALTTRVNGEIRRALSARHVPDDVFAIASVPRTMSGKKLELPVKKLLMGQPLDKVVNRDAMANPDSMDWFVALAAARRRRDPLTRRRVAWRRPTRPRSGSTRRCR